MDNLDKEKAELLEALLIISSKTNSNLLNKIFETRHLQQLDIESETFNERVYFLNSYITFNSIKN